MPSPARRASPCSRHASRGASATSSCVRAWPPASDTSASVGQRCDPTVAWCSGACQPKRAKGKACSATAECAVGYASVEHRCADPVTLDDGAPCGGSDPCKAGHHCNPVTRVCEKQLRRGLACGSALACEDGLACVGLSASSNGVCADWQDAGAACLSTGTSGCPATQTCDRHVCVAPPAVSYAGERCVTTPCSTGLGCNPLEVCSWLGPRGGACASSSLCEPDLVCTQYGRDLGVSVGVCASAERIACPAVDVPDAGQL